MRVPYLIALVGFYLWTGAAQGAPTSLKDLDVRLDRPVSLEAYGRPLWEVVQSISRRTGARIQVAREIRDQKVMVAIDKLPARQVLETLAGLFGYGLTARVGKGGQSYLLEAGKSRTERKRQLDAFREGRYQSFLEGYRLMRHAISPDSLEHSKILEAMLSSAQIHEPSPDRDRLSSQIAAVYQFATSFTPPGFLSCSRRNPPAAPFPGHG